MPEIIAGAVGAQILQTTPPGMISHVEIIAGAVSAHLGRKPLQDFFRMPKYLLESLALIFIKYDKK